MLSERELSVAIGSTAYDSSGDKIGTVEHFFSDDRTGAPTWVAVSTGLFGTRHSVVPAVDATFADGNVRLPVTVEAVKNAPHVAGDHLDPAEEAELRRHYGMTASGAEPAAAPTAAPAAARTSVPPAAPTAPRTVAPPAAPTQEIQAVPPPVPAVAPAGSSTTTPATDGAMTRSE